MADVDVGGAISSLTSGFNLGGITTGITILISVFLVATVFGTVSYIILSNKRFNRTITIFENLSGQGFVPVGKDKAMLVKVGDGGEEVLFLRKRKVYRTAYGRKIGKNHYAFAIGQDGYWYNVTFGNLDEERERMGMSPVDKDMRMMHVAIRRNIKDRYERVTFLQKYGGLIAYISLIAVTGIMMWLLFDKYLTISGAVNEAIQSSRDVLETTKQILSANDNILSGGTGIK